MQTSPTNGSLGRAVKQVRRLWSRQQPVATAIATGRHWSPLPSPRPQNAVPQRTSQHRCSLDWNTRPRSCCSVTRRRDGLGFGWADLASVGRRHRQWEERSVDTSAASHSLFGSQARRSTRFEVVGRTAAGDQPARPQSGRAGASSHAPRRWGGWCRQGYGRRSCRFRLLLQEISCCPGRSEHRDV